MISYTVSLEKNADMLSVGRIEGESSSDACFFYTPEYLSRPDAVPVSVSLPLREEPYTALETRNYFEGLLPEGFTRRSVMQWMHLEEHDYLSLLHGLGAECLGALRITQSSDSSEAAYDLLSVKEVRRLAEEGAVRSAEFVTKSHLSLTGASGKVGLYFLKDKNEWYLPRGTAPSTHIVKQSHVRLDSIVTNEQLCLMTAAKCGIATPHSFIINTGRGRDQDILLATERYDRLPGNENHCIDGLPCPLRLHQEDFAQALGIPSSEKYETRLPQTSDGGNAEKNGSATASGRRKKDAGVSGSRSGRPAGYLRRMFDLIRRESSDPITDMRLLWRQIVFSCLIGNTDSHVKNFSLLYSPDMRTRRLSPAYDILCTAIYESSTREMAFRIGDALLLDDLTEDSLRSAAQEVGLGVKMAMREYTYLQEHFEDAFTEAARELSENGFEQASLLRERILMQRRGSL